MQWLLPFFFAGLAISKPYYPLYGIDSGKKYFPNPTQQDLHIIATNFTHIQGSYSTQQLSEFHKANPNFKPVWYVNSDTSQSKVVEGENNRMGVAYYSIGTLKYSLTPVDKQVAITLAKGLNPLVGSTEGGRVSTNTKSVVWIRMQKELMKVENVSAPNGNGVQWATVSRGFANTPTHHSKDDNVFVPVYNGDDHGFPGNTKRHKPLDYCIDPKTEFSVAHLVNHTIQALHDGYAGSWIDCFSDFQYNCVDINGKRLGYGKDTVAAWDFSANAPYTPPTFLVMQKRRLERTFSAVQQSTGKLPTILANNIAAGYFKSNEWTLLVVNKSTNFVHPLDGYSWEAAFGREKNNDTYQSGCGPEGLTLSWEPYSIWKRNMKGLADAAQRDVAVFPMVAQAGCKSITLERVNLTYRDRFETYSYASFLLAVEKPTGKLTLGLPPFYQNADHTKRYAYVHPRYFWKIGTPTTTHLPTELDKYIPAGHVSYVRTFTNGVIAVNPTTKHDSDIPLGGKKYVDPEHPGNPPAGEITLPAQTGVILLSKLP